MSRRAVILGAGLTGLRAGVHLAERGVQVTILEREPQVGGLARSHAYKGYKFDHGPHGFYSRDPEMLAEFRRFVGEENYFFREKWSQVHYRGRLYDHPLGLADVVRNMGIGQGLRALGSFVLARARGRVSPGPEVSAEDFLVNRFGRVLYDEFFRPYTEKVWGVRPGDLDADFARDRVPHPSMWDMLAKMLFRQRTAKLTPSGRVATHDNHCFFYPRQGAQVLADRLVERVEHYGGTIELSTRITQIDTAEKLVYFQTERGPDCASYDHLVSTSPCGSLLDLFSPAPPADVLDRAARLRYRAVLLVCLCVNRPSVIGPYWIYFTTRLFNRLSEYNKFSPEVVPAGKTGLCLEIGCDRGDVVYTAADADIVRRVVNELEDLKLLAQGDVDDSCVIREPFAYPVYHIGYREDLRAIAEYLQSLDGVEAAGRQGAFQYINQDQALKSGREAAERVISAARRRPENRIPTKVLSAEE
jgi:protoporphyrinogen oxidase